MAVSVARAHTAVAVGLPMAAAVFQDSRRCGREVMANTPIGREIGKDGEGGDSGVPTRSPWREEEGVWHHDAHQVKV